MPQTSLIKGPQPRETSFQALNHPYIPIKAALADPKKVVKTGSNFMGRGRVMGRGSAESRLRGMGIGQGQCRGMVEGHGQG